MRDRYFHLNDTAPPAARHGGTVMELPHTLPPKPTQFQMTPSLRVSVRRAWRDPYNLLACFVLIFGFICSASGQQPCVNLAGSTTCPGFSKSYVSTSQNLVGLFPFLANVTDTRSFDAGLDQYVRNDYVRTKYRTLFGCSGLDLSNTSSLYARYTFSFLCNGIIQNSLGPCSVSMEDFPPLCADACTQLADSEQRIISSPDLCGNPGDNAMTQLRADWTNCALPSESLSNQCIPGYENEPTDCGYQYNLEGLCTYCNTSTVNSTDSCCFTSQAQSRCQNVRLPVYTSMAPLFPTTTSSPPAPVSTPTTGAPSRHGLSGGQIAGIVVGSIAGAAFLLGLLICCCLMMRRRHQKTASRESLNQPTPPRSGIAEKKGGFEALPGARVTRMAALEGSNDSSPHDGPSGPNAIQAARSHDPETSDSSMRAAGAAGMAPLPRRDKSTSDGVDGSSPESNGYSSGEGGALSQSEQMDSFKDYYSNDEIHPNDHVSTLWAYQPRASDEFELDRGDMLRVVGIWDDGWATGVRVNQRAENWDPERKTQRDSGVSGGPSPEESPPQNGSVKAFPLVCVCLPQHWRKTIEGDSTEPDSSE